MSADPEVAREVERAIRERLRSAGLPASSVDHPATATMTAEGPVLEVAVEDPLRLGVDATVAKAVTVVGEFLPDFVWKRYGFLEKEPSRALELSGRTYGRAWKFRPQPRR